MSKEITPAAEVVTLEPVLKAIQHWRKHKKDYSRGAMPDEVWKKVFILEGQGEYSPPELRRIFTLNSQQYNRKYQELMGKASPEKKPISHSNEDNKASSRAIPLAEAVIKPAINIPPLNTAADKTKKEIKDLKSTATFDISTLDPTTVVVECIRADGHRLKIHMTTQRIDVLMDTFFNQANDS